MSNDTIDFEHEYSAVRAPLKSFLYRMLINMPDTDDLLQDTYIKGLESINSFNPGLASFKTWIFTIASNLAINHLKKKKRWSPNSHDTAKNYLGKDEGLFTSFKGIVVANQNETFEIREHISYCFNCLTKVLPIEQQVALMLKDIYQFKVREIGVILDVTLGVAKHLLLDARKKMTDIFDHDCSLVNKGGACYKCTELNQVFNPKQKAEQALRNIELKMDASKDKTALYELRTQLVGALDPTNGNGKKIHEFLYELNEIAQGNK